jgi:hypothetical protein
MKQWIALNGPIAVAFECYEDLKAPGACSNGSVYVCDVAPTNKKKGGHCVMIVGYDDDKAAWLIRNSWGVGWGTGGYGWFGYGQGSRGLEQNVFWGVVGSDTNPDPWTKRRRQAGCLVEAGGGLHRDYQVWVLGTGGSVDQYTRDGSTSIWTGPDSLGLSSSDCKRTPTVVNSTYSRNFEVLFQTESGRIRHALYDQAHALWIDRGEFGPNDVGGALAFTQSGQGSPGDFEVVVRRQAGVLENWYRDNTANAGVWSLKYTFGTNILKGGASLVQRWPRTFGAPDVTGELYGEYWTLPTGFDYVCVTSDNVMQRWWRDDPNTSGWVACEVFGDNVDSAPVMIRSDSGTQDETTPGNFELAVAVEGVIQHWWMPGSPEPGSEATWNLGECFGTDQTGRTVTRVLGFMQSSYGFCLEIIAELDNNQIQHFAKDGSGWKPLAVIGTGG